MFRSALGRHAGIVEYQVRQTERGARIAIRCGAPVMPELVSAQIAAGLAALGVADPEVTVTAVQRLERDGGPAKLRRFVPLAAEPALT